MKIRKVEEYDMLTVYEQICLLEDFNFNINNFQMIFNFNIIDNNILYYLAESEEGVALGFISCHIQHLLHHGGKVAEIQELFVRQENRAEGVGQALVKFVEQELIVLNCSSFEVTAQNKRMQTHAFYKKMNFDQTHLKYTKAIT